MSERVWNAAIPPYSAVGLLRMRFSDGAWYLGTGALIDARNILTCAHNLTEQGAAPDHALEIRFYPGWNGAPPPDGGTPYEAAECWFWPTAYRTGQDAWDVGVVRLAAAVPREYTFQPTQSAGTGLVGEFLDLTGYPGARNGEMWRDHDQVAGVEPTTNTLLFTHDTLPGSSGSPVYLYEALEDVVRQYAVHVSRGAQELRRGVLLTPPVMDWLDRARATPCDASVSTACELE